MLIAQIHPDFRLQNQSFKDEASFLEYVKNELPESYGFLKSFLDQSDSIVVPTSGSTGKPKQIKLQKEKMLNSAQATAAFFDLPPKTKALHCLSTDYIAGKMMWVRALSLGWHLEVVEAVSSPLKNMNSYYDFAAMVPLQAQNSLGELHRIEKLIVGGAPISYSLEQALAKIPVSIYQTYGMTETITHIAVKKIEKHAHAYKSLPKVKLSVDDRDCLCIAAPGISETRIITNDIVKLISDTEFEWMGRYDTIINSGGVKLLPEQIEIKLAPFLAEPFFIAGIADKKLGSKVCLFIESKEPIDTIGRVLSKSSLSKYEFPKEIYFIDAFIRSNNNKVKRKETVNFRNTFK